MSFIKNCFGKASLVTILSAGLLGCATAPKAEIWGIYDTGDKKEEQLYKFYDTDKNGKCDLVEVYRNISVFSRSDKMPIRLEYVNTLFGEEGVELLYAKLANQVIERTNSE